MKKNRKIKRFISLIKGGIKNFIDKLNWHYIVITVIILVGIGVLVGSYWISDPELKNIAVGLGTGIVTSALVTLCIDLMNARIEQRKLAKYKRMLLNPLCNAVKTLCCMYYVLALVLIITQTDKVGVIFTTILTGIGTGCVNLKPNIIGMVFGRWDFASANRVLSPVTNFLKCSSYLVVAVGLKCASGYNMVYVILIGVAVVSFLVLLPLKQKCIGKQ